MSQPCQKNDWSSHKALCRALHDVENNPVAKSGLLFYLSPNPSSDSDNLNVICSSNTTNLTNLVNLSLGRPMNLIEQNLVLHEPKCLACSRSDRIIRIETGDPSAGLKSCPACHLAFYCSDTHWDAVSHKHASDPSQDGYDGLSQCALNLNIIRDTKVNSVIAPPGSGEVFKWAPERVKPKWEALPDEGAWDAEYGGFLREEKISMFGSSELGPPVEPFLRASSDGLSFPLTILYALQNLNKGSMSRDTLTIHILGATYDKELIYGQLFEEILHCLPKVKTLELVLCGPELGLLESGLNSEVDMDTCPICRSEGRKRVHQHIAEKYHDYASERRYKFTKPDLAIAFNSGLSQVEVESWERTIRFLVDEKIPSVFTSFNREEAEAEATILREAGADLLPLLGPRKNPWGSQLLRPEPTKVTGYYAVNGWLCAGFGGRP
ncbi:hypothetical protein D9757_010531 [Collybiopsis confluens]|uniref:Mitochondrial splicing suppressor 51-like C-terminal domain-containing protein n=1 Tax=Collybiopsis confluens TaxID=2823264 RepID=A0A8H5GNM6_9AGAR|nr:hypothetical protein D9757_011407 [Collybiopsis confluens]KAF5368292.1 hypothetical protein D9757_010531 [Collybiopsis confluens]